MNKESQKVIEAIMTRTSVRQYTDEAVTDQDTETLLKAGMAAPSACMPPCGDFHLFEPLFLRSLFFFQLNIIF